MLKDLPDDIKEQVIHYLKNDQFRLAKKLHDNWMKEHNKDFHPQKDDVTFFDFNF